MDEKLTIFIAVTSAAVVLQMLLLAGMFFTLRALSTHLKTTADDIKAQAFPFLENGKAIQADIKRILETSAPKVELVLDNAAAITTTAHAGIGRVESAVNDMLDRARLQVIRARSSMSFTALSTRPIPAWAVVVIAAALSRTNSTLGAEVSRIRLIS